MACSIAVLPAATAIDTTATDAASRPISAGLTRNAIPVLRREPPRPTVNARPVHRHHGDSPAAEALLAVHVGRSAGSLRTARRRVGSPDFVRVGGYCLCGASHL